ncbi:MAG TPA: universal stress protein [Gaiellaceae bacterium]
MKPVMLATDGSPAAEKAISTAVELAKLLGADLVVVTVWDIPYSTLGFAAVPPSAELAQIGKEQAAKVAAEAAARAEEVGVEARTVVLRGFPVEEICLAAEKYEPRFLVIGSHGWRTVKRVLFGSVSTGVLHHAACPVLVVRGEETPQNGAKADGAREHIHAVS